METRLFDLFSGDVVTFCHVKGYELRFFLNMLACISDVYTMEGVDNRIRGASNGGLTIGPTTGRATLGRALHNDATVRHQGTRIGTPA